MVVAVFFYCLLWGVFEKVAIANSLDVEPLCADLLHCSICLLLPISVSNQSIGQNPASVMYASIFPLPYVAPLLWMLAITRLGPNRNQYFYELDAGLYRSDCLCLVERGIDGPGTVGGVVIICGILLAAAYKTVLKTPP